MTYREYFKEGAAMTVEQAKNKGYRKTLKRLFAKNYHTDPLAQSMREQLRYSCRDEGETVYEYGIYEDNGETDDEIAQGLKEELMRTIPNSYYWDCTGLLFTQSIHWQRTPCGIAVVHRMGRDV